MLSSLLYHLNHASCWRGEVMVWDRPMRAASLDRLLYLGLHRSRWMGTSEAHLLRKLIRPGMRIVDVGANVGLYSLLLAELTGARGSVLAFEPEPNLFAMLVANCARNAAHNVKAIRKALGSANGRALFQRSIFNSGDNRLGAYSAVHQPVEVEVVSFDDLQPIAAVDFIKIDVQGHELDVLRGMKRTLVVNKDVQVLFEFCPSALSRAGSSARVLLSFFRERHFHLYQLAGAELQPVVDCDGLIAATSGNRYTNLLASRNAVESDD